MKKFAPHNLNRDELVEYTPEWKGERFEDGRPRVPDDFLDRYKRVTVTMAWTVLRGHGFEWQYEGDFYSTHPGATLVGRAYTAAYIPRRPDIRKVMETKGEEAGCVGDQISWPIDLLQPGDVYVADVFGKIEQGPIIGDNLSTAIFARSGNGVVHDAAVRDLEGIRRIDGFTSFCRGWHPSYASPPIMLSGVNTPVRIGHATVMPGDVVLGKNGGVVFIPPHLAADLLTTSELISLREDFGQSRLSEGVYTPGQIDDRWSDEIELDFSSWLEQHMDDRRGPREAIQEMLKKRTW